MSTICLKTIENDLTTISTKLACSSHLDDIVYSLYDKKHFSAEMYDMLTSANKTLENRATKLLEFVISNPSTIDDLIIALQKEGLTDIVAYIQPNSTEEIADLFQSNLKMDLLPYNFNFTDKTPETPLSPNFAKNGHNNTEPLTVLVRPCLKIFDDKVYSETYKNTVHPQGFLFLANVETFKDDAYFPREGSDVDVENLTTLFQQMGYIVVGPYNNFTRYELITAMDEFCSRADLCEFDSVVVAIMSHGVGNVAFISHDNFRIDYSDILERFNNRFCPALFGKPKIFIFQSCRGSMRDEGVLNNLKLVSNHLGGPQTDAAAMGHVMMDKSPTFSDMFIIHSSVDGFVSFRCPDRGSWLIEAICQEFMNYACQKHLESLMKLVSKRLKTRSSGNRMKQLCETRNLGFDKLFYFNPIPPALTLMRFRENAMDSSMVTAKQGLKRVLSSCSDLHALEHCDSLISHFQSKDNSSMQILVNQIKWEIEENCKKGKRNLRRKISK